MPVVPISKTQQPLARAMIQPPSQTFALMAAAQMHTEGRLIKSDPEPVAQPDIPALIKETKAPNA